MKHYQEMKNFHMENDSTWMGKIKEDKKLERHFIFMDWENQAWRSAFLTKLICRCNTIESSVH